ncbi:MAG TPA: ParB/RepB/Spo0J family partition protein [Gemmataceae bacterium]|nr:ParB/RepB/Spo0J family partition protein [Gemmataceae bacterium]
MNTIENTSVQPRLIAVSRLEKSPLNARRTTGKMGMDELKASLLSHGLMQNLVVTDAGDGRFLVIAGGRRLEAIQSLQAEGKLPEDFAVPCQVVADEDALELSLAENTVRLAMHPADQFEAFAALIDKGATAAEVAQRFGVEESLVVKRMKLARVAPQLLKEYRSDGMTLECLMVFTLTDDHRRQLKVFKSLQGWQKDDPSAIRAALSEKMVEADSKFARFVGVDAYVAAGGSIRKDLFGEEVYLENPDLLNRLAEEKLGGIRKQLEAEGWGWVEINPERDYDFIHRCSRLQPQLIAAPAEILARREQLKADIETARMAADDADDESEATAFEEKYEDAEQQLEQIEEQLSAYVGFDATQKALAGCYLSIGPDGSEFLDKGLVKPEHRKHLAALLGNDAGPEPSRPKSKGAMPESLRRDLAAYRSQIAQVEIAKHPAIALDLLTFQVASRILAERPVLDGPQFQFRRAKPDTRLDATEASRALGAIEQSLPTEWLKPKSEATRFEAFRSLGLSAKLDLLAYCLALTLQPKLGPADGDESTAYDVALALTEANVAGYWRPGKESYFRRITREQLLAIVREVLGDTWAAASSNEKKSVLVEQLDRAFADAGNPDRPHDQAEKLKSWLPAGMAFGTAPAPKPAKSRKARKAA